MESSKLCQGLTQTDFSSLCLTEKFWLIKYLNDVNLLKVGLSLSKKIKLFGSLKAL